MISLNRRLKCTPPFLSACTHLYNSINFISFFSCLWFSISIRDYLLTSAWVHVCSNLERTVNQVGDIVRMENNQFIAADVMLISTSEPNGLCYIETAELDGETNLKAKQCLNETSEMGENHELLSQFNGEIVCEPPNNILNRFDGTLIWNNQRYSVDNDKILLRGCVLRNSQWCYGIVIFAGRDTKLMQNSGKTTFKSTSIDRFLNYIIIGVSENFEFRSQIFYDLPLLDDTVLTNQFVDLFVSIVDCAIFNIDMLLLYDCMHHLGNDDRTTFYCKCKK